MPVTQQELDKFHRFVSKRLKNGVRELSLERWLAEFRAYQEEVASLNAELQESIEQVRRGEAGPLDVEQFIQELRGERRESVKAIQEALDDMEAGDTGRPLDEVVAEIRREIVEPDGSEPVFYRSQQR